jgi:hypothetical protein
MVRIEDSGSTFDAPIDIVWAYNDSRAHAEAHEQRGARMKRPSESQLELRWERVTEGSEVKMAQRITFLPPIGVAIEILAGPLEGSKFFNLYTPRGAKTGVTVVGEFTSKTIPKTKVKKFAQDLLARSFEADQTALRAFRAK